MNLIADQQLINEKIRFPEVRVVASDGEQLGIMSSKEAQDLAYEKDLDLVLISPNATPPVVKIIDYGKYKYEQIRRDKEAKKNQSKVDIKEIRMTPNIDTNDMNTKIAQARKFLEKGNKLKISLRFRGRELSRMNQSIPMLKEMAEKLSDIAIVEKEPKIEGRMLQIVLAAKK
ncbi:MAG: translation initiation factor IF-3 [Eubacteriales bacterium]|nr:translation initiation factor IF-3 [Eubacteriales bacterium]